jgi:UDPglucose--hexose-1-phosphate uridylyltransferase
VQTEAKLCNLIFDLVEYAIQNGLAEQCDRVFLCNRLCREMGVLNFAPTTQREVCTDLETILSSLCDIATEKEIIPANSITERDLFDTHLMGILTPRPSEVQGRFASLYQESPQKATDYYYHISRASDYIRTYRTKKDLKWTYSGKYGEIDITINLSKPEKTPAPLPPQKRQFQADIPNVRFAARTRVLAAA